MNKISTLLHLKLLEKHIIIMVKFRLNQFEIIGVKYAKILEDKLGIKYLDDFYRFNIEEIQKETKIEEKRLIQFSEILELFKIPTLSIHTAEMLHSIYIRSIEDLAHQNSVQIHYKLRDLHEKTYLIELQIPTFDEINMWIYHAKLMSKRNKYSLHFPVIMLPQIDIDKATELFKYQIITVEHLKYQLEKRGALVKKRIFHEEEKKYADLKNFISLLEVDGIDIYFARLLTKAEIKTIKSLRTEKVDILVDKIKEIQDRDKIVVERLDKPVLMEIRGRIGGEC
ncbi:MAG: DUF4332 domain-containing protein [Candidatus Lokiarchaeota archaeon]|nr:DUF4332 domain-containing protein [Candidatus Lokiarchaeota archaeon]